MLTVDQLQQRMQGIGGSDAGAIMGLNPYRSAVDVYLEKRGEVDPPDLSDNQAVHFGNVLEDVVAQEYARRTGHKVRRRNQILRHPEHPFMLANLDRTVDGQRMVLECKTAGAFMADKWGDPGTDQVPDSHLVQVTHYMIVTGYQHADLAVLIGGQDFRIFHFQLDPELAALVIDREQKFWQHITDGIPPAPTNARDLETLYAQDNGQALVATAAVYDAVRQLHQVRDQGKEVKAQEAELVEQIKFALGEHSHLVDTDGQPLVTWKKAKDSQRFDSKAFQKDHPNLHAQYLKTKPGNRRFLLK